MMRDVEIPQSVLKRAIALALEEVSAGMTAGHRVGAMKGMRPNGDPVLIKGLTVLLVPEQEQQGGLRLAAVNGQAL